MVARERLRARIGGVLGAVCLGATLLLTPLGVRTVAADGDANATPAAEPATPSATPASVEPASPASPAPDADPAPSDRPAPVELDVIDAPELVPLNTQGYNYRPEGPVR